MLGILKLIGWEILYKNLQNKIALEKRIQQINWTFIIECLKSHNNNSFLNLNRMSLLN